MAVAITLILNGIANSALYFLMSAGLTLIFGLLRIINFAHGGIYLWGAYVAVFLYSVTHQFAVALVGGIAAGLVLGWLTERLLRSAEEKGQHGSASEGSNQLLLTMGALIVLDEAVTMTFGRDPINASAPSLLSHSFLFGNLVIVVYQLLVIVIGIVVYVALQILLRRSRLGMVIRAGVYNRELVEARGIPIRRVFMWTFILGAALAGFAGALAGPYFGSVTPEMGMDMQLNTFIIVVLGGLGSLSGSLAGSLLIGVATALVSYFAPSLAVLVNVLLMAGVLMFRPNGLLGERGVA
jgi:branched-chain amino acid transport system permease protein